jgi:hypothetical protein
MRTIHQALRAVILAAILWLAISPPALADHIVTAQFQNVTRASTVYFSTNSGGSWTATSAGQYNWSNATGSGTAFIGTSFWTCCIEVAQNIVQNGVYTYTLTADVAKLPQTSFPGGMGSAKAQQLGYLLNAYKTGAIIATMDVLQATCWNIVHDTDFNTSQGTFRVSGGSAFIINVNALLANVSANYTSYNALTAAWAILGLTNDYYQDQIVVVNHQTYMSAVAPAPAGWLLAGIGVVICGSFGYLRRRTVTPSAVP